MMFCCGGPKQRTLLSSIELGELLRSSKSNIDDANSFYLDRYLGESTGHTFLGHIQVDGGGESSASQICSKIRKRAKKLYNTDSPVLRQVIEEKHLVLSYLCQSVSKANQIEKELLRTTNSEDSYGIWFNVCPIANLQNTIDVKQSGSK